MVCDDACHSSELDSRLMQLSFRLVLHPIHLVALNQRSLVSRHCALQRLPLQQQEQKLAAEHLLQYHQG